RWIASAWRELRRRFSTNLEIEMRLTFRPHKAELGLNNNPPVWLPPVWCAHAHAQVQGLAGILCVRPVFVTRSRNFRRRLRRTGFLPRPTRAVAVSIPPLPD